MKYNVAEKELDLKLQKLQIQSYKLEIAEMEKELDVYKRQLLQSLRKSGKKA